MAKPDDLDMTPFREVIYIVEDSGNRGGKTWILILDCGHIAFRPKRTGSRLSEARRFWSSPNRGLAPKRCRCNSCAVGIPKIDPKPIIELHETFHVANEKDQA